jgi:hypothetical protein
MRRGRGWGRVCLVLAWAREGRPVEWDERDQGGKWVFARVWSGEGPLELDLGEGVGDGVADH